MGRGRWLAFAFVALAFVPSPASAKQTLSYEYRFSQVWSSVFRLIRVDMECSITDRDDEIGFLMFQYADAGKNYAGSVQLVPIKERGKDVIRVEIQIPEQPTYVEVMIMDKLSKKLLEEYGEPVVAPPTEGGGSKGGIERPKQDGGNGQAPRDGDKAPKNGPQNPKR